MGLEAYVWLRKKVLSIKDDILILGIAMKWKSLDTKQQTQVKSISWHFVPRPVWCPNIIPDSMWDPALDWRCVLFFIHIPEVGTGALAHVWGRGGQRGNFLRVHSAWRVKGYPMGYVFWSRDEESLKIRLNVLKISVLFALVICSRQNTTHGKSDKDSPSKVGRQ